MTLDEQLLVEARAVRERLLDLQHEVERARADYQHSIRRLHAAGGSMREIAEVLGLSHQRVHQIVDAGPEDARPRGRRLGHRHGGRFTRAAREAVVVAQEEASALGHAYIGTEHLLLGLLRVESGGAASALASLGITYDGLRADVGTAAEAEPKQSRGRIPFTATAKKALQQAADEAASRRNRWVGTEHVLLGVSAVSDSLGAELLTAAGADQAKVREAVERALGR